MLISPLFTTAVLKVQVAEHEERTRELAVRLGKLRQKALHPQFRFRLAVCLALTYYSDQIMEQHFFESASKYDKSGMRMMKMGARGNTKIEQARGGSNIECMRCLQIYGKP